MDTTVAERRTSTAADLLDAYFALPVDHHGRRRAREKAIEAWLPLARHLAQRYTGRGEPTDDLVQTASLGLVKAIDRFEPDRGIDFAGFAIPTIIGELKRHFRDRTWSVRVPRRLQELRLAITTAETVLTQALGRSPTVADVAAHLGVSEDDVLDGLEGARAYRASSLSTPIGDGGDATELGELLGGDDPEFELAENRLVLGPALGILDDRERRIVILRFHGNLTQAQIADQVGISQMHVSRLITRALAKLRRYLEDEGA
ncbi:RNA polymerase sigma-B factor [Asanoa hainanensis]|uniref:RNA polymerase sigma-B factor n=1 Tax=Asanoa hainanensis TaxID=560556 RepID=A0A239N142_9ACTN|nr:RNA polymerase sigma factor SigF [Asanoa hainanensis]SNT47869.1 RNA polymerase sigma-B factor [Asanoa hainanensis]